MQSFFNTWPHTARLTLKIVDQLSYSLDLLAPSNYHLFKKMLGGYKFASDTQIQRIILCIFLHKLLIVSVYKSFFFLTSYSVILKILFFLTCNLLPIAIHKQTNSLQWKEVQQQFTIFL